MKGSTHTLLGAAVVLPLAITQEPLLAAGCLWLGMAGGRLPDWLDLRSDFRSQLRLRHRGASHGLLSLLICVGVTWGMLYALQQSTMTIGAVDLAPSDHVRDTLARALTLGFLSHLAADACTVSGIRPFLPFLSRRVWLLPRALRGRTGGPLDSATRWVAVTVLAFGVVIVAARWPGVG